MHLTIRLRRLSREIRARRHRIRPQPYPCRAPSSLRLHRNHCCLSLPVTEAIMQMQPRSLHILRYVELCTTMSCVSSLPFLRQCHPPSSSSTGQTVLSQTRTRTAANRRRRRLTANQYRHIATLTVYIFFRWEIAYKDPRRRCRR